MGPPVKRSFYLTYCSGILLCSSLGDGGNGTKRKIVSNSPYEGEYARIRSNIVVRYQGSIHGLIFTHKNGPIFLTASKPSIGPATSSFMPMCYCPSPVHLSLSFGQFHAFVLAPSGITPASRKCHSATISLRARATIAIRRTRPAESPTRVRNHRIACSLAGCATKSRPVRPLPHGPFDCPPC
jgi:hypothetical protein